MQIRQLVQGEMAVRVLFLVYLEFLQLTLEAVGVVLEIPLERVGPVVVALVGLLQHRHVAELQELIPQVVVVAVPEMMRPHPPLVMVVPVVPAS
jgi:hypothetical protein